MSERSSDPTTRAIEEMNGDRDRLRAENLNLGRALFAAHTAVEVLKTELGDLKVACDRLAKIGDATYVEGYDQAVREILTHFARTRPELAREIQEIWLKEKS